MQIKFSSVLFSRPLIPFYIRLSYLDKQKRDINSLSRLFLVFALLIFICIECNTKHQNKEISK